MGARVQSAARGWSVAVRVLAAAAGAALLSMASPAQAPPPAPQNPSPMVETTRTHVRHEKSLPDGDRFFVDWGGEKSAECFLPRDAVAAEAVDLLIHFHGAGWLPQIAAAAAGRPLAVVTIHLGAGSGVYRRAFDDPARFEALLAGSRKALQPRIVRRVFLSGFSAGYGAIRENLRNGSSDAIAGILLLDGLHASYVPERKVLADGGSLDEEALAPFLEFAREALDGRKAFVLTHSEIFPGTFASTTETADALLAALGLKREPVLEWGPGGMQQLSRVDSGGLHILGFAGNSAPDHVDHFHAMPELVRMLVDASSAEGDRKGNRR